ncbi:MAG: hypothetical protein HY840_11610 [Bacteroidetes bacterium]|nr:hypothetical protein [Bacteroidota bacterium]
MKSWTKNAAHNSTFAIGGVSCSADSFVVAESSVLRINFSGKKPVHRKSANRFAKVNNSSESRNGDSAGKKALLATYGCPLGRI